MHAYKYKLGEKQMYKENWKILCLVQVQPSQNKTWVSNVLNETLVVFVWKVLITTWISCAHKICIQ